MKEDNPERETNRGLMGTDADPSGHGVKTDVQEDPASPTSQMVMSVIGSDTAANFANGAPFGLKGGSAPPNSGPVNGPFRDAVENEARAMDLEATGVPDVPPDEAYRTTAGDNLDIPK